MARRYRPPRRRQRRRGEFATHFDNQLVAGGDRSDTYPFRWRFTFQVREFEESTLDDLARLAEQE